MNNKYRTFSDLLISLLFVGMITMPLLFMPFSDNSDLSGMEKRRLAPMPPWSLATVATSTWQTGFDAWFQDHFGLRSKLLDLARRYRESLFAKSISDNVIIGDDGWRFYDIDGSLYDFMGMYAPSKQRLAEWATALELEIAWFHTMGIEYLHVPIPGKMTMYREFLPRRVRNRAGTTRLDEFRNWLDKNHAGTDLDQHVVDARAALTARIDREQLYFKTDTHWNDLGAYLVYVETMRAARRWFSDLYIVPESLLQRVDKAKTGDIARASGIPGDQVEATFALTVIEPCARNDYREVVEFSETEAFRKRPKRLPVINGCPNRPYRAIVVHDSFGQFLKQFVNESFGEVVYMPSYDLVGMQSFIEAFDPDIFIDFRVDRRFHLLLQRDPLIEEVFAKDAEAVDAEDQ